MMTVEAADRQGWRQAFIILMSGLRDEFLNHVKRAVTQLPAADRTWEQIKETASIQQDHESNRRTRSSSFSKGTINYTGQQSRSNSLGPRGAGGGGGGGKAALEGETFDAPVLGRTSAHDARRVHGLQLHRS